MKALLGALAGLCLVLSAGAARAQFFSPGPLARPHANLEGLENCGKCHEEQKGLAARLCLDCHKELAGRVAKGSGFHGHLQEPKRSECAGCHPDHRGRDISMIEWEPSREKFDHRKTGWALQGAHAQAKCDDCHQRRLLAEASIRRMLEQQPKRTTMLGLSTRCDSCHFDEHRGQLGLDCAKCHKETAWKPAAAFDHQRTTFPLKGEHRQVACAKCHPTATDERSLADLFPKPRAATFMRMQPIEHGSCESCHQDPHKGSFGPNCASCHSEAGWKVIQIGQTGGQKSAAFHDKTRFPLRGGHVGVACRSCHGPFPGRPARFKGLPFASCTDCHQDAHLGQLRVAATGKAPDCDACHTVNAFTPARYELEQHAATAFPLEGGHAVAPCRGCHVLEPRLLARVTPALHRKLKVERREELFSQAVMRPRHSKEACASCHADVHRGQFADGKDKQTCDRCHQSTSFGDLTFDHDTDSRFPLTGKHGETPCAGCHRTERLRGGETVVRYKPLETGCAACHADVHRGQFAFAVAGDPRRACEDCHQTASFKKTLFDHNDGRFTAFALEGKHAQVACAGCHRPVPLAGGATAVRYRPLPRECESCHVDYHKGEFRGFEP